MESKILSTPAPRGQAAISLQRTQTNNKSVVYDFPSSLTFAVCLVGWELRTEVVDSNPFFSVAKEKGSANVSDLEVVIYSSQTYVRCRLY